MKDKYICNINKYKIPLRRFWTFCTFTSKVWGWWFLANNVLPNLDFCQSEREERTFQCSWNLHFLYYEWGWAPFLVIMSEVEHLFMCLKTLAFLSAMNYVFCPFYLNSEELFNVLIRLAFYDVSCKYCLLTFHFTLTAYDVFCHAKI